MGYLLENTEITLLIRFPQLVADLNKIEKRRDFLKTSEEVHYRIIFRRISYLRSLLCTGRNFPKITDQDGNSGSIDTDL